MIRNCAVFHKFVLVSGNSGLVFYSFYCPGNGIFGLVAREDDPVIIESLKIASPVLQSDFLIKKTIEFIITNPKKVFFLELKKILYLWAPFDWEIIGVKWFNLIYVMILPFFALGLLYVFKQFKKSYVILLPIIYFQFMTLIFYGSPRFRLAIDPYIFILAAAGIFTAFNILNKRRNYVRNMRFYRF